MSGARRSRAWSTRSIRTATAPCTRSLRVAGARGHRRRADRHRRPLARAALDHRRAARQGRLLREALSMSMAEAGRCPPHSAATAASSRPVASGATAATFELAVELVQTGKLGKLQAVYANVGPWQSWPPLPSAAGCRPNRSRPNRCSIGTAGSARLPGGRSIPCTLPTGVGQRGTISMAAAFWSGDRTPSTLPLGGPDGKHAARRIRAGRQQ